MMKEMYKGIVNSPITSLSEDIGAKDTDIKVVDSSYLPAAPNLAVIGTEGTAETIKYAGINENILTGCTRGFQGVAKAWDKDTLIARNFTAYDLAAVQENITTLDIEKASNQEFKDFQGSIQEQLNEHEIQSEANLTNYAKKTELSAAETRLDKKIDAKVSTTTFEDFKNTNQTALDKKTNNTDFDIYKKEVTSNLAKKVDKVSGKGLSTNDYDDVEKAEVAKIKNLATSETVAGIKSEVETLKTSKVDKVVGKGLSTNDYDNTEKAEVAKVKNKADTTYVNNGLNNKADKTELNKKIDKTSITSDLAGTDENKVLSQKAGSLLEDAIKNIDLSGKIDKSSITNSYTGTSISEVLSQKGANDLFKALSSGNVDVKFTKDKNVYFYKITYDKNKEPLIILFSPRAAEYSNDKYVPVGFRPKLSSVYKDVVILSFESSEFIKGSFSIEDNGKMEASPINKGHFLGFTLVYFGTN